MSSFSIRWLFFAVAFAAVSVAALLNANDYWLSGFQTVAFLSLLTAVLGAIFSSGERRAFWAGWLVFGGAWFVFATGLFEFSQRWRPGLITTGLTKLHGHMFEPTIEIYRNEELEAAIKRSRTLEGDVRTLPDKRYQFTFVRPSRSNFTAVGNAVLCIPFALVGGVMATWFQRRRR